MWGWETEGKGKGYVGRVLCVEGRGEEKGDVRLIGKIDSERGRM